MRPKRVFLAFAIEDQASRNLLMGQSLHTSSPFEYTDMSVKEPWSDSWKSRCRIRIRGCDGVIALLSRNTLSAPGARWEIKCAIPEKKPLISIFVNSSDRSKLPEMADRRAILWSWNGIANFINSL